MGILNFFKKQGAAAPAVQGPYQEQSTNLIYQLLFCDNLELYRVSAKKPYAYPFDILFSGNPAIAELTKITSDRDAEPRLKLLAFNRLSEMGQKIGNKELEGVIIEVGLDKGLDVLASFRNGTARYINQSGKILIWESADEKSLLLTNELFARSEKIISKIGAWDKPRLAHPVKGNARISFLVSDGLYFGEASADVLFRDPLSRDALLTATSLMQYLTEKSQKK